MTADSSVRKAVWILGSRSQRMRRRRKLCTQAKVRSTTQRQPRGRTRGAHTDAVHRGGRQKIKDDRGRGQARVGRAGGDCRPELSNPQKVRIVLLSVRVKPAT